MWGLGRPVMLIEMGRICGLGTVEPGQSIRQYERGDRPIPSPLAVLVTLYLRGILPTGGLATLRAAQP
jgi:hypothetical protein